MTSFKVISAFVVFLAIIYNFFLDPVAPILQDGYVVITGCSPSGLGFQLVKDLLAGQPSAVKVICTVRKDQDRKVLEETFGVDRLKVLLMDVTEQEKVKRLETDLKDYKIIALVNNAGISDPAPIETSQFRKVMDVNLFGAIDMTVALLSNLKRSGPGSRIVHVGSIAGLYARPRTLSYSSSKRALEAASDVMRMELQPDGISVSIIQPGFFASNMCVDKKICTGGSEEISKAVIHALFSPRPKARYPVGTVGIPAFVAAKLYNFVPDRVLDFIIPRFGKTGSIPKNPQQQKQQQ